MAKPKETKKLGEPDKMNNYRWQLARNITLGSIAGIAIIAGLALWLAKDKSAMAQMVFTATIPLLASWVGTVLAYYFSSESLEAATRSVKALVSVEEKLETIPVADVMIKIWDMTWFKHDDTRKVKDILEELKIAGKGERLPFLDENKQPVYMLHKSSIDSALVEADQKYQEMTIAEVTFQELFEKVPSLKALAENSFGILDKDASLKAVRSEMAKIKNCQDVFITENGTKFSPVIGWVTNGIVEENAKL
jgi:hypothetical protein